MSWWFLQKVLASKWSLLAGGFLSIGPILFSSGLLNHPKLIFLYFAIGIYAIISPIYRVSRPEPYLSFADRYLFEENLHENLKNSKRTKILIMEQYKLPNNYTEYDDENIIKQEILKKIETYRLNLKRIFLLILLIIAVLYAICWVWTIYDFFNTPFIDNASHEL